MPVIRPDRLPLPNLKTYTFFSVLALSMCLYIASDMAGDEAWSAAQEKPEAAPAAATADDIPEAANNDTSEDTTRTLKKWFTDVSAVMIREPFCVWVLINMTVCGMVLLGRCIQKMVFGELRVSEQQHLKDKFWNFIFYKFIFIFGVINVQSLEEVLLWCSWFALLGFLQLIAQLSKDRFEYLSFSPTIPIWSHVKLIGLLACIFAISSFMLMISVFVGFFVSFNTLAFMSPEVLLLSIRTLHVILRYGFHLYDLRHDAAPTNLTESGKIWEKRGPVVYYVELGFELTALTIDLFHHLHMLLWSNIFLSMASLVICMQLRYLFQEIQRRIKKHRNYLWVRNHLEQNYPMALPEELSENSDNCAICWEKMETARKLPCSHLFHNTCLQSWLEQDTSCPTCRLALSIQSPVANRIDPAELQNDNPQPTRREINHFFHFDGSRYVSWLPSFFVEVRPAPLARTDAQNSQLDAMARQVQQLFAHIPLSVIVDDLRVTRSVELTIENILDGRLVAPPTIYREPEPVPSSTTTSTPVSEPLLPASTSKWGDFSVGDHSESLETDDAAMAGRFSKCPEERERILQKRKEHLIHAARKRYIEKQHGGGGASES